MIAYKLLAEGRLGPFSRFLWPEDEWVEVEVVAACRSGIHACRVRDLPYWLATELWEIELDGDVVERERKVVAPRGRLRRRIAEWNDELLRELTASCRAETELRAAAHPTLQGFVTDIDRFRGRDAHGLAAFAAARAAELSGGPDAYDRERLRQAGWLAERLGLPSR